MSSLIHKIFGTFDITNKDIAKQIETKEEEDYLKSPVKTLDGNEKTEALLATKSGIDPSINDSVQVSPQVDFSQIIADHTQEYSVDKEYQLICQVDSIHQTLVNKGVDFSNIRNTLDILSEDLYSTENTAENSLWGAIAREHKLPNIRSITAAVHPEIYHNFAGFKNAKFGGMGDAHLYPSEMFARWVQSGNVLEFPKQTGGHVTREALYGKEVGQRIQKGMFNYYLKHNKIITGKFGGKLSGALYAFMAIGIILARFEIVNWREEQRQRLKYGLRILDDESPQSITRREISESHQRWLSTYYEEEEEEEEEEDEEDEE